MDRERLGGGYAVLSSDLARRLDGSPVLNRSAPDDPGVALYFRLNGKPLTLAADRFTEVAQNVAAIAGHIDALRRQERYGVATAAESLRAFEALPPPPTPWETLDIAPGASRAAVEAAYRAKAKEAHPDRPGGSHDRMAALSDARDRALASPSPDTP